MAATYEPIATTTLGSAASSITFSSISSAYTDLRLVVTVKASSAGAALARLQFNSDTATNYSYTRLGGDGATATSARTSNNDTLGTGAGSVPASGIGLYTFDIFSYAGSTYKTALVSQSTDANGSGTVYTAVGLWRSTSAINSINIGLLNGDTGTTATLYGIKAA